MLLRFFFWVQELARNNNLGLPPQKLAELQGTRHADFCERTPCGYLHPGRRCSTNVFAFLPRAYLRALPVYAPVYILPAILVHRQKLLKVGELPFLVNPSLEAQGCRRSPRRPLSHTLCLSRSESFEARQLVSTHLLLRLCLQSWTADAPTLDDSSYD